MHAAQHASPHARRAFTVLDFFWLLAIIFLLISILLPSLARAREISKRAVCAANLRGIGQGIKIYANENRDWYPIHVFTPQYTGGDERPDHGVRWVGTMGATEVLKIMEPSTKSPQASHPSRSLFMLVIEASCTAKMFICPSSRDAEDDLGNRSERGEVAAHPGVNRFDFRGYPFLSYGYQLPYGPNAQPHENLDPRVAIMADKGPYYEAGGEVLAGSGTVTDRRSALQPPALPETIEDAAAVARDVRRWRTYNSRNHKQDGQNVQFGDGHVDYVKTPIVGVNYDNIYTIQANATKAGTLAGVVPDATQTWGPFTQTDSFIVP